MGELGESPERTSGWLKLATAGYYCGASMAVQFANKVAFTLFVISSITNVFTSPAIRKS